MSAALIADTSGSNRLAVLASEIREAHDDVSRASDYSAERAVDAGRALVEAWSDETIPRGQWRAWVEGVAGLPWSTAKRYKSLYIAVSTQGLTIADIAKAGQIGALKAVKTAEKGTRRAEREAELAERTLEAARALGSARYGVIYADPPWRFEPYSRETGMDRAADNHYPTMTIEALRALDVPAADDCVLFMWATVPMLPEALAVMDAWGFSYRSHCVWLKDRFGTGYWFRNQHELLLVGTRGDVPAPAPGEQYASVIEAELGPHSAKPGHFAEMIEELFPTAPRLEMFARAPRLGWDVWGNEACPMAHRA